MSQFERSLEYGRVGERVATRFLQRRGWGVVPSFAYTDAEGGAPRLMFEHNGFVVPDLDTAKGGERFWVEVKTLSVAPYNRTYGRHVHGIHKRLYIQYLEVERQTGCAVYLCVLEIESGEVLFLGLSGAEYFDCQCSGCSRGWRCTAGREPLVYFFRDSFKVVGQLSEYELAEIKEAREVRDATG